MSVLLSAAPEWPRRAAECLVQAVPPTTLTIQGWGTGRAWRRFESLGAAVPTLAAEAPPTPELTAASMRARAAQQSHRDLTLHAAMGPHTLITSGDH